MPETSDPILAAGLALIFDMDGVIVHSNPAHEEAWTVFNRGYGLETTPEMIANMYGKRNDEIVRDFYGDGLSAAEVFARGAAKEKLYREMIAGRLESMLVPGLRDFLEAYRCAGLAVASNAEPENVNYILDRANLRQYFQVVVDGHQVSRPKPFPDVYLRAALLLGVAPQNCIVLEDSTSGIAAARAAGMRVIGIRTTHVNLPGASITTDNFLNGSLRSWLKAQQRAV